MSAPDETRATLRRLVETQAAALREVTAQRDALRDAAKAFAVMTTARVQAVDWDNAIAAKLCELVAAIKAAQ